MLYRSLYYTYILYQLSMLAGMVCMMLGIVSNTSKKEPSLKCPLLQVSSLLQVYTLPSAYRNIALAKNKAALELKNKHTPREMVDVCCSSGLSGQVTQSHTCIGDFFAAIHQYAKASRGLVRV